MAKRITFIIVCLAFSLLCLLGCEPSYSEKERGKTPLSQDNTETTKYDENNYRYEPGSIELSDLYTPRKYRLCYYYNYFYQGNDCFLSLGSKSADSAEEFWAWDKLYWEENPKGEEPKEMYLKAMVVRFNIPKEDFCEAVEIYKKQIINSDGKVKEIDEVPNADVIYTFDDDIINSYYRYE